MSSSIIEETMFYTVEEIAAYFKVSKQTIWRQIRKGDLPPLVGVGKFKGYSGKTILTIAGYSQQQAA